MMMMKQGNKNEMKRNKKLYKLEIDCFQATKMYIIGLYTALIPVVVRNYEHKFESSSFRNEIIGMMLMGI